MAIVQIQLMTVVVVAQQVQAVREGSSSETELTWHWQTEAEYSLEIPQSPSLQEGTAVLRATRVVPGCELWFPCSARRLPELLVHAPLALRLHHADRLPIR